MACMKSKRLLENGSWNEPPRKRHCPDRAILRNYPISRCQPQLDFGSPVAMATSSTDSSMVERMSDTTISPRSSVNGTAMVFSSAEPSLNAVSTRYLYHQLHLQQQHHQQQLHLQQQQLQLQQQQRHHHYHQRPLYSYEDIDRIFNGLWTRRNDELCERCDTILLSSLAEQREAYVNFTYAQIRNQYRDQNPSYMS